MSLTLDRLLPRALIAIALAALSAGGVAWASGNPAIAHWVWAAGAVPVIGGLVVSIVRDLLAGRLGVDAVALLSMIGALALRENLAAIVVAVMHAGGNALEEFAVSRAERDLKSGGRHSGCGRSLQATTTEGESTLRWHRADGNGNTDRQGADHPDGGQVRAPASDSMA